MDGGYGWIVVLGSFFVHFLVIGLINTFGIYYYVYIDEFNAKGGQVAWIGSIGAGLMALSGMYAGKYADIYGNSILIAIGALMIFSGLVLASLSSSLWHLYLSQGLICGIGYSLCYISGVSVIGQWFTERRGLAVGIAVSGSGIGQFVLAPLTQAFLNMYGWRKTLRITASIALIGLLLCASIIRRNIPLLTNTTSSNKLSSLIYFQDHNFRVLYITLILSILGYMMPFTHIVKFAVLHGISVHRGVLLISILGIASAIGRAVLGYTADTLDSLFTFRLCISIGGVSTLLWPLCTTYPLLVLYVIVYGFFGGGLISLMPVISAELFGSGELGVVMGLLYTSCSFGNFLGGPIGGELFDLTGTYGAAICVAGSFMVCGALMTLLIVRKKKNISTTHSSMLLNRGEGTSISLLIVSLRRIMGKGGHYESHVDEEEGEGDAADRGGRQEGGETS
jgi:MFS family permease